MTITGTYKDEKVIILFDGEDRVSIWIPSRQEEVWVKRSKIQFDIVLDWLDKIEAKL